MDNLKVQVPPQVKESIAARRGKLQSGIQPLRTHRKKLAPINVLPVEVLSKIFILVRDLFLNTHHYTNHHATWIWVGHICRHWREVALSDPNLWSVPVFTRPHLAREMLQRSKMAPLTIMSPSLTWNPRVLEQLENALVQVARIQSIDLTLKGNTEKFKATLSLLSQPTPLLENIVFIGPLYSAQVPFPSDILPNAPRLRSITLISLAFSWESAIFKHRHLTDLHLKKNLNDACTVGQMMDTLHQMPNLRNLDLADSVPPHTTSNKNEKTLQFKFLERLGLRAKAADCIFFLRHIRYPPSAKVRLQSTSNSVEDCVAIISLLGKHSCCHQSIEFGSRTPPVPILSARLISFGEDVVIAFFDKVGNVEGVYRADGPAPTLIIRLSGDSSFTQGFGRLLTSVGDSFELSSLKGLLLDWSFTDDHIPAIRQYLGKLPKLTVMNLSRSLLKVCIALTEDEKPETPLTSGHPLQNQGTSQHPSLPGTLLPFLRTLMVYGADFREPNIIDRLTNMLIKRSNLNVPIDKLTLERHHGVRTWHIRLLGELVVDLETERGMVDVKDLESDDNWDSENSYVSDESNEDDV